MLWNSKKDEKKSFGIYKLVGAATHQPPLRIIYF